MNNTYYLNWTDDLLPSDYHRNHTIREFIVCYLSEAIEGQALSLSWDFLEDGSLHVDAHRKEDAKEERVFAAKLLFAD